MGFPKGAVLPKGTLTLVFRVLPPFELPVEEALQIDFSMHKHCGIILSAERKEQMEWRKDSEYGPKSLLRAAWKNNWVNKHWRIGRAVGVLTLEL